jgi:hypothetical protein
MSDIYLQITETPTVVTLSAPVVSGALASTVTVANTVTVALDSNSLSALENVTVTVGAAITGTVTVSNFPSTQTIAGTVTANVGNAVIIQVVNAVQDGDGTTFGVDRNFPVDIISALPAGTNRIGVVTIGAGTVTIGAGTAQIGSVTASISSSLTIGSIPAISGTVTVGAFSGVSVGSSALLAGGLRSASVEPLRLDVGTGYLQVKVESAPSISGTVTLGAGTAQIGSVTASISNSVVTFYPMQGTTVTNSNFTSTTASTTLASAVAGREVLTVFNEGAGNLHISPGATCTTVAYQVRLSSGDYWECPAGQLSLAHTAVFATAGTARVTEVS